MEHLCNRASEMQECRAYWQWAQHVPVLKDYLYKIVNEGRRSPVHGHNLKLIGLRRGLPDYHYPVPNDNWVGFWLEMKTRDRKSHIYPCQEEWIDKLNKIQHYATFAYGWEDAAQKTLDYINNNI